jgi:hypothetical protein
MVKVSPPAELDDVIGGGICSWWRFYILQTIIPPPIFY